MRDAALRLGRRLGALPLVLRLVVGALVYLTGALLHARWVNVNPARHDQLTYLEYARIQAETHFTMPGNRLQMPALPTLLALFVRPGESVEESFARAKLVCIGLSLLCLGVVLALARRCLPVAEARLFALLVTFFVFCFRAAYVQAELLAYTSGLCAFLLMLRAFVRPSLGLGVAVGGACAASFFCKASATLGLYVFLALLLGRAALALVRRRSPLTDLGCLLAAAGSFALCIFPYARTSKAIFGSYLHNINTRYVMWCDSWEEFLAWQARSDLNLHGWRLPPEQVPSLRTYLANHSAGDLVQRELRGLAEVLGNCLLSHGYAPVLLLLGAGALLLCGQDPAQRRRILRRDAHAPVYFVVPYLLVYLASFGWFGVIAAGNRFALGLLMPATWALLRMMSRAPATLRARVGSLQFSWSQLRTAALVLLAAELCLYWPWAIVRHYAGG